MPLPDSEAKLVIRREDADDFEAVRHTVQLAFGRPNEADLVERIRASNQYVPDLALVAEHEGEIVGYVLLSYVELQTEDDGASLALLALAPLAVRPDHQHQGVGAALTEAGVRAAEARREPAILVLGHPRYYNRFGFEPARPHGIDPPWPAIPDDVFMVKLLSGYDGRQKGQVVYPPAFDDV